MVFSIQCGRECSPHITSESPVQVSYVGDGVVHMGDQDKAGPRAATPGPGDAETMRSTRRTFFLDQKKSACKPTRPDPEI